MLPQIQAKLSSRFVLSHHYGLVIPSTVNVDEQASAELIQSVKDIVERQLSTWFGGFTAYNNTSGGWLSSSGQVVKEPSTVYISNCTEQAMIDHFDAIEALAISICTKMSQEAVSLIVDGALALIEAPVPVELPVPAEVELV